MPHDNPVKEFFWPSDFEAELNPNDASFWIYLALVGFLLFLAAWSSGLNVGLMAIDEFKMRLLERIGTRVDKSRVKRLKSVLSDRHCVLTTILLINCISFEWLPICLNKFMPEVLCIILSVSLILIFGEILPQALCLMNPLACGAQQAHCVWLVDKLCWPISKPLAMMLDCCIGSSHSGKVLFSQAELMALLDLHQRNDDKKPGGAEIEMAHLASSITSPKDSFQTYESNDRVLVHTPTEENDEEYIFDRSARLDKDTVTIMQGALKMKGKSVADAMTPLDCVYMLPQDKLLDATVIDKIIESGHSRIPVYNGSPHCVVGMLLVKKLLVLIGVDLDSMSLKTVGSVSGTIPLVFKPTQELLGALNEFQKGHSHLAIITEDSRNVRRALAKGIHPPAKSRILGIITLEDVVEELIQEEIEDEHDIMPTRLSPRNSSHRPHNIDERLNAIFKETHASSTEPEQMYR